MVSDEFHEGWVKVVACVLALMVHEVGSISHSGGYVCVGVGKIHERWVRQWPLAEVVGDPFPNRIALLDSLLAPCVWCMGYKDVESDPRSSDAQDKTTWVRC